MNFLAGKQCDLLLMKKNAKMMTGKKTTSGISQKSSNVCLFVRFFLSFKKN